MHTIGLLGGMSWESTLSYYKALNEGVRQRLGGLHSAPILLHSVDFAEIEQYQRLGDWATMAQQLTDAAQGLEKIGADFIVLCTNTMHKIAPEIEGQLHIPLLHIADATGLQLRQDQRRKVGLLGTRFTMEEDFYKQRLTDRFGIEVLVPDETGREQIHRIIYDELCQGVIREDSRAIYLDVIQALHAQGAEGVILGCTEIALLVQQGHTDIPLYDTTYLHAEQAVKQACGVES
ncbi:aspartate/glutamate racemase [Terasakiispira papahanaumokuakeensis]|uniref:Aspartate/glutamate racemase n=1 Tax=Terasakiispira papahanaumokuakeensis TaxID=197479 RepID=A0A1E2V7M4_9GAMM|nr:aspartate/glutamate racemase family protein [Terasakiispira papahanaumokuakeensis]ODC03009.1 aspartate/glutamate racemase [Terasakiispira papahanaumokuakeensis]